jgi:hypothetical protein
MKKLMLLIVLCCVGMAYSSPYPIFNGSRSFWSTTHFSVDDGTTIGLTNPSIGDTPYDFVFVVEYGDLDFDISSFTSYPISGSVLNVSVEGGNLFVNGIHDGPGNPVENIGMNGDAYISVFEDYEKIGTFTVGSPIPEPMTILLLSFGTVIVRRNKW